MPLRLGLALVAALLVLPACDSGSDAAPVSGRYTGGRVMSDANSLVYTVVLAEAANGSIDGIGTFTNPKGTQTYYVAGTRAGDEVSLLFRTGTFNRTDTFTATVSADAGQLDGTITGFFNPGVVPFVLTRIVR